MHLHENRLVEENDEREIHYKEIGKHTKPRRFVKKTPSHVGIGKAVLKTLGPEGNQNAKNLAKPWIRAIEACLGRQLCGVVVGKLSSGWSLLTLQKDRAAPPASICRREGIRNQNMERPMEQRSSLEVVRLTDTQIDTNCGYHMSGYRKTIPPPVNTGSARGQTRAIPSEFLNTPETEGPGGERDGWGWTDLFHEFVSVEAGPSLKCIRALSVLRRLAEIGIHSWFGFEGRLEPVGLFDKLPQ
ncbi:hypothetical protein DFH08DRAFT_813262 [Mycena albidolilacea]|uniref:Uncharacterized protein n=1 Tax=Mycena albidolilacea TaxID=1033008 RepID=A0AAD6ZSI0_9AGAR|nr:hypothetical protein DFH08DRAFT_813262 [Mycena albidolilacea]